MVDSNKRDQEVVAQVLLGRNENYELLVRKYQQQMIGFCRGMLGEQELARDAAQDIFLKAYSSLDRYSPTHSFKSWLFQICRNHCIDLLRARGRKKEQSLDTYPALGSFLRGESTVQSRIEAKQLALKLLGSLSEEQRECYILREMYGFRYDELAGVLGCTVDAVKGRLKRARVELEAAVRHFESTGDVLGNKEKTE